MPFFCSRKHSERRIIMDIKKITRQGIVAAIYVVMTVMLGDVGYGAIQFRVSEILAVLPFFNAEYIYGITIGVFLANIFSTLGAIDIFVGTLASFLVAVVMSKIKNFYLACIVPLFGMILIALEIFLVVPEAGGFWAILSSLVLSEFIAVYVIGVPVFYAISKNKKVSEMLNFKKKI